jgi:hypothetical protein
MQQCQRPVGIELRLFQPPTLEPRQGPSCRGYLHGKAPVFEGQGAGGA